MSWQGAWSSVLRQLTIPQDAPPNESAILLQGKDSLPSCMQADYSAAILFRPQGNISNNIPYGFIAQRSVSVGVTNTIDEGWLQYDQAEGVCRIWIVRRKSAFLSGTTLFTDDTFGEFISPPGFGQAYGFALENNAFFRGDNSSQFQWEGPGIFGQDLDIYGDINWGSPLAIATTEQSIAAVQYTSTSTGYTETGAVFVGVAFYMPPSQKVLIHYNARMRNNTAGQSCFIAFVWKTGGTVGSGTTIYGPTDDDAIDHAGPANNSDRQGVTRIVTGTAGDLTNAYLVHRVEGGTGTFSKRSIYAQPVI